MTKLLCRAGADDSFRRKDDRVPARGDILGCQWRAIGEFDPLADLKGVGLAVIGWLWHRRAQIADEIVGLARVIEIGAEASGDELLTDDMPHLRFYGLKNPECAILFPLSPTKVFIAAHVRSVEHNINRRNKTEVVRWINDKRGEDRGALRLCKNEGSSLVRREAAAGGATTFTGLG